MTETPEFMWAVGLYEGEGCASLERISSRTPPNDHNTRLTVVSTDLDVLEKFNQIVACGYICSVKRASSIGTKQQWHWRLARQADIAKLLSRMMPHLGQRRQIQAQKLLDYIYRPSRNRSLPGLPSEKIVRVDL